MKDEKEILKLIEAFLDGELSDNEKIDFERRLKTDKALQKTWNLYQEVDLAIDNPAAMKMEKLLDEVGNEFSNRFEKEPIPNLQTSSGFRYIRPLLFVASIILIVAFAWWKFYISQPDSQQLYATYYEPYTSINTVRSNDSPFSNRLTEGYNNYNDKKYKQATAIFRELSNDVNSNDELKTEVRFYKGLSHLGLNELDKAQAELETVLKDQNHSFSQQTQWYLALIELKKNNIDRSKYWLKQAISTTDKGKIARLSNELLNQLELKSFSD